MSDILRPDLDLKFFEELLRKNKARMVADYQGLRERAMISQKEATADDSSYDQHPADAGTETFEREKEVGMRDHLEIALGKIDRALERIEKGTYGICLRCKGPIPRERLKAIPEAELCVKCQKEEEVPPASRRPLEERLIRMDFPFEGTDDEEQPGKEPPLS